MKLQSNFALLDVEKGRRRLEKHFATKDAARIPVVIHGWIEGQWGSDDGTSIEFNVKVDRVEAKEAEEQ